MYEIKVKSEFSSAHSLRGYRGKCEELHGHNWQVQAVVSGDKLNAIGMVIDFKIVKSALKSILDKMDHKHLNRISYFKKANPTSEQIAKYIYTNLKKKIPQINSVTVWESANASATYKE